MLLPWSPDDKSRRRIPISESLRPPNLTPSESHDDAPPIIPTLPRHLIPAVSAPRISLSTSPVATVFMLPVPTAPGMLNSLIANIQDAIVLLDANGAVVFESPSAAAILGVRSDQVLRAFGMSRIHPEDRGAVVESFERLKAVPGYVFRASYRFQRSDGEWRHLEALAKNLLDDPELEGILVTFRDVTERIRAIELAEKATGARDEFLSRMSHELKTPLNAIIGWGRLLQEDGSNEVVEAAAQIVAAGNHLLAIICDALDLAAVQEGKVRMQIGPVFLRPLVCEMVDLVRPLAARRGIQLEIYPTSGQGSATERGSGHSAAGDVLVSEGRPEVVSGSGAREPLVVADEHRLRQVLLNLLSNAVKYGRPRGTVEVGCRAGAGAWRIFIRDDGPGIANDLLGRLFERFDRLDAGDGAIEGSGLGLAISRRLIDLMGGSIRVESAVAIGTTFWIELPAIDNLDLYSEPVLPLAAENRRTDHT